MRAERWLDGGGYGGSRDGGSEMEDGTPMQSEHGQETWRDQYRMHAEDHAIPSSIVSLANDNATTVPPSMGEPPQASSINKDDAGAAAATTTPSSSLPTPPPQAHHPESLKGSVPTGTRLEGIQQDRAVRLGSATAAEAAFGREGFTNGQHHHSLPSHENANYMHTNTDKDVLKSLRELDDKKHNQEPTHTIEITQISDSRDMQDNINSNVHNFSKQRHSRRLSAINASRGPGARVMKLFRKMRDPVRTVSSSHLAGGDSDGNSRGGGENTNKHNQGQHHQHQHLGSGERTERDHGTTSTTDAMANTNLSLGTTPSAGATTGTSRLGLLDSSIARDAEQQQQHHHQENSHRPSPPMHHQQEKQRRDKRYTSWRRQLQIQRPPIAAFRRGTSTSDLNKDNNNNSPAAGSLSLSSSYKTSSDSAKSSAIAGPTGTGTTMDYELGHDVDKKTGVLTRVYDTWSLIALTVANIGPVAGAIFGVHTAKEYGGYSMLAIGWPLSGLCMCLFSASLAELSSSYPVAGAMFTWTFRTCRLSPTLRPFARFLSWLCGSLLLCGHVLSQMLLEYQIATVLQGLIVIFAEDYRPNVWKTIALSWGCLLVSGVLASNRMGRSPVLWKGVSLLILATTILLVASLFSLTTFRNSASTIFTSYSNLTGFTSKGYVYLVGWVLTSIATGQDVASHLAEESKHPTKSVPLGVFWGTCISYLLGWIVMLTLMTVTPLEPEHPAQSRDFGAPAQMLTHLLPRPLAFIILLMIVILMIFQDTAQLLASSRFIWALARDSAVPFSSYLGHLSPGSRLPKRATWVVCAVAAPCLLLIAGSSKIVTSLILAGCGTSLVLAYVIPVLCYLACPAGALDADGRNEWTLRGASKFIGAFGSLYVGLIIVMMCCPHDIPITSTSFSYAAPVIVFVLFLSSMTWVLYGNSHYAGPIKSITVYTIGREVELPKLNSNASTNRATPFSGGKPSDPRGPAGQYGFSGPTATTGFELGKTANLYSESLATLDLGGNHDTQDLTHQLASRSWRRRSQSRRRTAHVETEMTGTQGTDYTEYTNYTDESGSETGSEGEESVSGRSHGSRRRTEGASRSASTALDLR